MKVVLLKTILFEALKNRGFYSSEIYCYRELKGSEEAELGRAVIEATMIFGSEEEAVKNYDALYNWARYEY